LLTVSMFVRSASAYATGALWSSRTSPVAVPTRLRLLNCRRPQQ
jgi:hypothetical protein